MAIDVLPLPLPPSADPSKFVDFGREVKGVNPGALTDTQFKEIHDLLYKVSDELRQPYECSSMAPLARCPAVPRCEPHS